MRNIIEKLLVLQERDRRILRAGEELTHIGPERQALGDRLAKAKVDLEELKLRGKLIEAERKKLELEGEANRQKIERYSMQQFQTKKNEEYKALAQEIEHCRQTISQLEDQQLELMEQAEIVQRRLAAASQEMEELAELTTQQLSALSARERELSAELAELEDKRDQLTNGLPENILRRYERLLAAKGGTALAGISHGVCEGCHMRFPVQLVVQCQAQKELVICPNCSRILYYSNDMNLAVID